MKRLLTSCFGLGLLGGAPGTFGSVPPVVLFMALSYLDAAGWVIALVMLALALGGSAVCVLYSPPIIQAAGTADPREIVADEFAGQAVTFMAVLFFDFSNICTTAALGFLLFRLLDIVKPWPIKKAEKLPKGWGILADDLAAGLIGAVSLIVLAKIGAINYLSEVFFGQAGSVINFFDAILLGALQGVTEFLPVSSSGHLVLLETLFHFEPADAQMILFDLSVHVGTVVAIIYIFRRDINQFIVNLFSSRRYGKGIISLYTKSPSVRFLMLAVVATAVTGAVGFLFENYFVMARGELAVVAVMWIITGTLLLVTDFRKRTRMGLREFGMLGAVLVGLAQAFAIFPGISRSGATICTAILIGLHRRWAVEFSLLLAVPAIAGAALVKFIQDFNSIASAEIGWGVFAAGFITAALTGIFALKLLVKTARKGKFRYFAVYCYLLAITVLSLSLWK